jgi:hypothetical protein
MTIKTKPHIYHVRVKSTITYAAETWCLKAKTLAKLNSTEIDFWRRSARVSRKDKIRNSTLKQRMNVTKSLLDDYKVTSMVWTCSKNGRGKVTRRSYELAFTRKKKKEENLNSPGRKGLED